MRLALTLVFRFGKRSNVNVSESAVYDIVFAGNGKVSRCLGFFSKDNVCPICHSLLDIITVNVHDLDFDL